MPKLTASPRRWGILSYNADVAAREIKKLAEHASDNIPGAFGAVRRSGISQ